MMERDELAGFAWESLDQIAKYNAYMKSIGLEKCVGCGWHEPGLHNFKHNGVKEGEYVL